MIVGPAVITLALLPFRSSIGLGGFLFCELLVVTAVAVIGGARPALAGVVLGVLAGAFFFAPPYENLSVDVRPDLVSLVAFAIVGPATGILIGKLAQLAEEHASSGRVEAALRRVATLVAGRTAGARNCRWTRRSSSVVPPQTPASPVSNAHRRHGTHTGHVRQICLASSI